MDGAAGLFSDDDSDSDLEDTPDVIYGNSDGSDDLYSPAYYPKHGFVGLDNLGATCYLNSLIQSLYMTHEFRAAIFALKPEDIGVEQYDKQQAEEKENENAKRIAAKDIEALCEQGFSKSMVVQALIEHDDVIAASHALMDGKYTEKDLSELKYKESPTSDESHAGEKKNTSNTKIRRILIQLQRLFARMQLIDQGAVSTIDLTDSFGWNRKMLSQQNDVHELIRVLIDAIHRSLPKTGHDDLIDKLYRGQQEIRIICSHCGNVSIRSEAYLDCQVTCQGVGDLNASLRHYVQPELLVGDNKYRCGVCNEKRDAKRSVAFKTVPPLLTISLNRFAYDLRTYSRVKLQKYYSFPQILDLGPYMEENLRQHLDYAADFDIEPLMHEKELDPPEHKNSKDKVDTELSSDKECKEEKDDQDPHALQQPEYDRNSPHLYQLYSVVIHSGSPFGGHYHAYINDVLGEGPTDLTAESQQWFDYNDTEVTPVETKKLAGHYGGDNGFETAYMLMYRRIQTTGSAEIPKVPQHLVDMIELLNKQMDKEREEYFQKMNQFTLAIHHESRYEASDGILRETPECTAAKEQGTHDFLVYKLTLDRRKNLDFLKQKIIDQLSPLHPNISELNVESIKLHKLNSGDESAYLSAIVQNENESDSLVQAGLRSFSDILVWNGETINNKPFGYADFSTDSEQRKILFDCAHYSQDYKNPDRFSVILPDLATVADLVQKLKQHTKLQKDLLLHTVINDEMQRFIVDDSCMQTTFADLGFHTVGVTITVEDCEVEDSVALKARKFSQSQVKLTIFDSSPDSLPILMAVEKSTRVGDILETVKTHFPEERRHNIRLRKLADGNLGNFLADPQTSLTQNGINSSEHLLQIEHEPMPNEDQRLVFTKVVLASKETYSRDVPLIINTSDNIHICKQKILDVTNLERKENDFILYWEVDEWMSDKLLDNEHSTVGKYKIGSNHCLILKEGSLPEPDKLNFEVFQYTPVKYATFEAARIWMEKVDGEPLTEVQREMLNERSQVDKVYDLPFYRTLTIQDLKDAIHSKIAEPPPTSDYIRLFKMNNLYQLYGCLTETKKKLSKLKITDKTGIAFQILDNLEIGMDQSALLNVYMVTPLPAVNDVDAVRGGVQSDADDGEKLPQKKTVEFAPNSPVQVLFALQKSDNTEALRKVLAEKSGIDHDKIGVAKFWGRKGWHLVSDDGPPKDEHKNAGPDQQHNQQKKKKKKGKRGNQKQPKKPNIRSTLQHGAVIGIFDAASDAATRFGSLKEYLSRWSNPPGFKVAGLERKNAIVSGASGKSSSGAQMRIDPGLWIDLGFDDDL